MSFRGDIALDIDLGTPRAHSALAMGLGTQARVLEVAEDDEQMVAADCWGLLEKEEGRRVCNCSCELEYAAGGVGYIMIHPRPFISRFLGNRGAPRAPVPAFAGLRARVLPHSPCDASISSRCPIKWATQRAAAFPSTGK